jgi:DNA (cytosine-5)-methyltransferase 1
VIYGSLCSGIEAATQAWHPLGWTPAFFSEIDRFPSAVLAHHYPHVPNFGDMTKFQEWPDATVDVLVGGTPCQSFSVAGLRKGLDDPRGDLMLTFGAVARRYRPRWIVWENVPGVLSSNKGRDFGTFLGMLAELGYGFAYRVLDAQYVRTCRHRGAVPQRRRRVFVVGYLGDWRRAAAVLFDRESLRGDPPPRREAGESPAPTVSARPTGGGGLGTDFDLDGGLIAFGGNKTSGPIDVATACQAHGGPHGRLDFGSETFVAHALRGEGFDASEDGTGRGTPLVPVAVAIQERAVSENPNNGPQGAGYSEDGAAYTLEARHHVQAVAFDLNQITSKTNRSNPDPAVHHTLPATSCAPHLATPWAVRRLTPRECERLQGFPDGFTDVPYRNRNWTPDGPRYKALGNSMAVNCMTWLGERIQMVDGMTDG